MVQEQRELQYYLSARPLFGRKAWLATTRSVKYGALCIGLQTGQTQRLDGQREREMGWSRTRGGIADETTSPSFQAGSICSAFSSAFLGQDRDFDRV